MATPVCSLTEPQIRALYKAVSGKIIADKNNGVKHDIEAYMKKLYEMLKNAPNGNEITAMDYIQHIPRMVLAAKGTMNEEYSDYLSESGMDLNRIDKLRMQFKDIENVKTFLNVDAPNLLLNAATEVLEAALPVTGVLDNDAYAEIEINDEKKKVKIISENPFEAFPETAFAQVNQEAQDYDGINFKENIPDPDPKKQTYFSVVRMINKFLTENRLSNMNSKGIYLRPVKEKDIPFEDLYISNQKYLTTADSKKTTEQKEKDRETGDNLFLVYTDENGKFLYFDKEGNISTKEDGGTVAYSFIRRVYTDRNGNKKLYKVQSVEDLSKKTGAPSKEKLQKGRDLEMEILEKMRKHVMDNPEDVLLFSVAGGQNGYITEDFSQRNKISDIQLEDGFSPYYSTEDTEVLQKGGVYFQVNGYDLPVLIKPPSFSEIPSLVEALTNVLFDSNLDNAKKIEIVGQFLNSRRTELYEKDGKVFIKLEKTNELLDVTNVADRQTFIDGITKLRVNINKNLLGNEFQMPILTNGKVDVKFMIYNNFISDNFYTNLQTNADKKIIKLNAYNVIQPTGSVTEKLFPIKVDEKTERIHSLKMVISSYENDVIPGYKEEQKSLVSQKNLTTNPDLILKLEEKIKEYEDVIKNANESLEQAKKELTSLETTESEETARTIYDKLGSQTQSKNVILPENLESKTPYTTKNFWNIIVPEARDAYDNKADRKTGVIKSMLIAYRGNSKKTFLQNYKNGNTVGNPFDWQTETGTRDEQGIKSTKRFIHWMITGDNMGITTATEEYRQAIIDDIKSGKIKNSPILYYQEKGFATHATALDYLINKYDWNKKAKVEITTPVSNIKVQKADIQKRRQEELDNIAQQKLLDEALQRDKEELERTGKVDTRASSALKVMVKSKQDKINAKYDAELARELYKEMKTGKLVMNMTLAEQVVAEEYITEELRDSVDAEITALEKSQVTGTENLTEQGEASTLEQATPSDNPLDVLKEKLKGKGRLLKASTLDSTATDEQIAAAERWYNTSPLKQYVPFQVMLNIINSNASAEFTLAGITLYAGSNFTDLYHEGWHVFSQLFLTKGDKKKLYNEARNLTGSFYAVGENGNLHSVKFNEATDIEIEEFLAEDFRKYVLSKGKKIIDGRPSRNNIFKRIYNFLKALFNGQSYTAVVANLEAVGTIKNLYDNLYIGNVNDYKPSLNNVQFTLLNKGIQVLGAKEEENNGLNYQDSMTLVQTIDSELAGTLTDLNVSLGTVFRDPDLTEAIYNVVKSRIAELKKDLDPSSNGAKIIDFAMNNWGSFKNVAEGKENTGVLAFHKLRSDYISFDEKYAEMSFDEKDIAQETKDPTDGDENKLAKSNNELAEEFGSNTFERKGNENSVVSMASNETVYLIKSLPAIDKDGKVIKNSLGSAKLVDFNRTWGLVINAVAGAINKTDMYKKLTEASKLYPELVALVDRLQDPNNNTNIGEKGEDGVASYIYMWSKFHTDFSVYRIPITEVQVIREIDSKGEATGSFEVRFVESDPIILQVERNFNSSFETAYPGEFISRTEDGVNKLEVGKILTKFPRNTLFQGENAFDFLKAIGFYLTDNPAVKKEVFNSTKAIRYLYDRLESIENENKIVTKPLWALGQPDIYTGVNKTGASGRVNDIMKIEGKYSGKYSNNSITNVQGDQEYDLSLNNTITQLFKELNDILKEYGDVVAQPHMAHLDVARNPLAKYSIILNSLFDLPLTHTEFTSKNKGKRRKIATDDVNSPNTAITITNLNGIKSMIETLQATKEAENGIKTTSLDINSKFLMDVHSMLEKGVMELTRRGSKSSAFGVSVTRLFTKHNNNDRTSYISTGYFNDKVKSTSAAVDLIKDKIAAEMERIAIVKTGEFDNIPGFSERGLAFSMFDDILTSPNLKEDLIKAANADNSFAVVTSPEFSQRIYNDIEVYLEKLYKENKALFDDMPFLSKQMITKIEKLSVADGTAAKNTITQDKAEEIAIRSFTVNALIHNMEIVSVIDGDLAMYNHLKEDYNKRNTSVTSTGRIFSSDPSDYIIMSNLRKGKTYANKIGAAYRSFNGILNTVIFGDNNIKSIYYDEYVQALTTKYGEEKAKAILKKYSDNQMNEGDGQGWITFDAYRELSLLEGSWSPKQTELYNKIINDEKVNAEELIEFFPPRKYQYAGPLKTSRLHIQAFHKFSLVPLIPTVIEGTNMQTIHDNLVKQGVDYALFESGSKLGRITSNGKSDKFYSNENRTVTSWDGKEETKYVKNGIFLQYLKNQVDITSKWKNKTIFSTQLRKLIINDLFKQGLPNTPDFGKIVNKFENLLTTLQDYKKQELLKEIGWLENEKGEPTGDPEKFISFVRKELTRQDLADHDINFIDLNPSKTGVKYDLSYSLNAEKIEKLLNAIVVKRLVRQKMNGEQLVQVSTSGFESNDRTKFTKASAEDILKYRGTNDLPAYRPGKGKNGATTAMKIKIAIKGDYYKLLELYHNDGKKIGDINRLNAMIKSDKWLDKDDNRKLITMVGVRIPVQGLNSMEFMEIYEFLPEEAGNIIITASEIVAKSGGDFDIDKLTIFQPNYSSSKSYASYSNKENAKGTENKIIEIIREILEHPENFDALIRPNDTDLVTGVADDLAKENIQGYNPLQRKDGTIGTAVSPTRSLEPRYNLYKHESNNVGKKTLGIGAVDNAYSCIFKRIGAYLNTTYTYKVWDKETGLPKTHTREINLRMDHNKMMIDGVEHISLSNIDTITGDKISDLISQLMNGWVDVEKDAWIFNLNGNNVAGPVLLFMLEAGVDFRTAAYFVSQPLIIDYIKERTQADSPFYQSSGKGVNLGKGLNKVTIRRKMLGVGGMMSAAKMYKNFIKDGLKGVSFTKESLLKTIKAKDRTSPEAKQALIHFFELEDIMRDLTNVKLTMNVDTKPSKSFAAAQFKLSDIEGLDKTDVMSQEVINKIKTTSPVSSFFIQLFQLKLFKPLMKIRADETVNNYLKTLIDNGEHKSSFLDPEKFIAAYKNDIPLFILQNHIKGIDLDTITEYNSLKITKSIPVEGAQLNIGAFVKDGVMHVDKTQIEKDFNNKSYSKQEYTNLGLHKLNSATFSMAGNEKANLQEYINFVLEREYLRSIMPFGKDQSRENYENTLADKALERTFNFYHLLKGTSSVVNEFDKIKTTHKEGFVKNYMLFDQLTSSPMKSEKGVKTLKLRSGKLDADISNILYENLTRLSDINTIKVENPAENAAISRFFSRLIVAEYLRNGITKTSDSLAPILPSEMLMRLIEEPMRKLSKNGFTETMLNEYTQMFKSNWALTNKDKRNKFRNYIKTTEYTPSNDMVNQENGVNVYGVPFTKSSIKSLTLNNPNMMFVIPTNEQNINEDLTNEYKKQGNFIGIPIKQAGGQINWTDDTFDKNVEIINNALTEMEQHVSNGVELAFPKEGLTILRVGNKEVNVMEKCPRTFEYLAKELYKRFGYLNPGAENFLGFRDVYQADKKISDKDVEDFFKVCFG